MIFVTGFGQMCNNILQFGHLYAWGKEHGVKVIAMRFCYKYPFFKISSQRGYNWFAYLWAKYGAQSGLIRRIDFDDESSLTPSNLHLLLHARFVVAGGWQFRDYEAFLRKKDELRALFAFKPSIIRKVNAALPAAGAGIRLGVHIRRGDYARWQEGRYLFSDEDYLNIIRSFAGNIQAERLQILIATNDPSLSLETYRKALGGEVCGLSGNAGEDLYALSTCHYIMGAPSTFSLMASFYNDTPLYWIFDKHKEPDIHSFRSFDYLFRHII
ncbi:MAG: alpha-1,2-fucosyltransferase [Tannerellaceae bacterium]|jgi:hypothetical protein|nr:alpha-1,2-fucosyltransferase [Tannerellaceae bacterium]